MKTLKFEGYSDDTFGCDEADYDNCASGQPIVFNVVSGGAGVVVSGQYAPVHCGGWLVGVSTYDPTHDDVSLPPWPMRIEPGSSTYTPALIIEVPDDAEVTLAGEEGED